MSSDFAKYFSPRHISSLAKVGQKIRILRGRPKSLDSNLRVGKVYTVSAILDMRPGGFLFRVKERPGLLLKLDYAYGYAAELASTRSDSFIAYDAKNTPEDV